MVGGAVSVGDRTSCRIISIAGGSVEGGDGEALRFCHICACCSDIIMAIGAAGLRLVVGVRVGLNEAVGLGEVDGIAEMEGEEDAIKVVDDVVAGGVVVVLLSDVHGD